MREETWVKQFEKDIRVGCDGMCRNLVVEKAIRTQFNEDLTQCYLIISDNSMKENEGIMNKCGEKRTSKWIVWQYVCFNVKCDQLNCFNNYIIISVCFVTGLQSTVFTYSTFCTHFAICSVQSAFCTDWIQCLCEMNLSTWKFKVTK